MSFLVQCCLSGQSIREREMVYVVPIIQASDYRPKTVKTRDGTREVLAPFQEVIYADSFWEPFGHAMLAKMGDCGHTELALDPKKNVENVSVFLRFIDAVGRQSVEMLAGENSAHDHAFVAKTFFTKHGLDLGSDDKITLEKIAECWEALWHLINDDCVYIADRTSQNEPRVLRLAYISKAAWDAAKKLPLEKRRDKPLWKDVVKTFSELDKLDAMLLERHKDYLTSHPDRLAGMREVHLRELIQDLLKIENRHNPVHAFDIHDDFRKRLMAGEAKEVRKDYAMLFEEVDVMRRIEHHYVGMLTPYRYVGQDYQNEHGLTALLLGMRTHIKMAEAQNKEDPIEPYEEGEDPYYTYERMKQGIVEAMRGVLAKAAEVEAFAKKEDLQ